MGIQNEDSFGWTDYAAGLGSDPAHPEVALGAGIYIEFAGIEPLIYGSRVTLPFKAGSTTFIGALNESQPFFTALAGGFFLMGNLIQRAHESALNVTTLRVGDETGQRGATWVAPTGNTIQFQGLSALYSEHTADFTVPVEQSFSMHSNRGAAGVINGTLPSGARLGTCIGMVRMGPQFNIRLEDSADKFWMPTSGFYKPLGQSSFMTASGTSAFFIKGSNNDWVPWFVQGTIV